MTKRYDNGIRSEVIVMAKTASVRLTDHVERFIEEQTASGRYTSLQEVFEAGIELLERQQDGKDLETLNFGPAPIWTREALEEAIREGEESGIAEEFDIKDLLAEVEAEIAAERLRAK